MFTVKNVIFACKTVQFGLVEHIKTHFNKNIGCVYYSRKAAELLFFVLVG